MKKQITKKMLAMMLAVMVTMIPASSLTFATEDQSNADVIAQQEQPMESTEQQELDKAEEPTKEEAPAETKEEAPAPAAKEEAPAAETKEAPETPAAPAESEAPAAKAPEATSEYVAATEENDADVEKMQTEEPQTEESLADEEVASESEYGEATGNWGYGNDTKTTRWDEYVKDGETKLVFRVEGNAVTDEEKAITKLIDEVGNSVTALLQNTVTSVILESGITGIGWKALYDKGSYEPQYSSDYTVDKSKTDVFKGFTKLTSVTPCETLKRIGWSAFRKCTNLKDFDFTKCPNLEEIMNQAFNECKSLNLVDLSGCNNLDRIAWSAFNGAGKGKDATLVLPENGSLSEIGGYAFNGFASNNKAGTDVDFSGIADSTTKIMQNAFNGSHIRGEISGFKNLEYIANNALKNSYITYIPYEAPAEEEQPADNDVNNDENNEEPVDNNNPVNEEPADNNEADNNDPVKEDPEDNNDAINPVSKDDEAINEADDNDQLSSEPVEEDVASEDIANEDADVPAADADVAEEEAIISSGNEELGAANEDVAEEDAIIPADDEELGAANEEAVNVLEAKDFNIEAEGNATDAAEAGILTADAAMGTATQTAQTAGAQVQPVSESITPLTISDTDTPMAGIDANGQATAYSLTATLIGMALAMLAALSLAVIIVRRKDSEVR